MLQIYKKIISLQNFWKTIFQIQIILTLYIGGCGSTFFTLRCILYVTTIFVLALRFFHIEVETYAILELEEGLILDLLSKFQFIFNSINLQAL